ncbi:MAG TPA: HAD family phosphatase [Caulobacterales bacterium]|nr:HAD family phosphatase [Caulobacterales bacterium]
MSLPRKPVAAVFDLDGTLIDSEALVRGGYLAAAPRFGIEMTDEHFLSFVGLHRDANDARLRTLYGKDFPLDDFYAQVRAHIGDAPAPLKPGALDVLNRLDTLAVPYALATSSQRPWVDRHFEHYDLARRFRAIIARGDVEHGKPHPEPYIKAAAALGAAPEFTLAVEDSHAGVASAHAAGLMTVMVPDLLPATDEMRAKALRVLGSLNEIVSFFEPKH